MVTSKDAPFDIPGYVLLRRERTHPQWSAIKWEQMETGGKASLDILLQEQCFSIHSITWFSHSKV